MASCNHLGPAGKSWVQWWSEPYGFVFFDEPATETRCLYCGEPAPMPARDDGPHAAQVAIEIAAAFAASSRGFVTFGHKDHHDHEFADEFFNFDFREDCDACWAQELAQRIAAHDGEHR